MPKLMIINIIQGYVANTINQINKIIIIIMRNKQ